MSLGFLWEVFSIVLHVGATLQFPLDLKHILSLSARFTVHNKPNSSVCFSYIWYIRSQPPNVYTADTYEDDMSWVPDFKLMWMLTRQRRKRPDANTSSTHTGFASVVSGCRVTVVSVNLLVLVSAVRQLDTNSTHTTLYKKNTSLLNLHREPRAPVGTDSSPVKSHMGTKSFTKRPSTASLEFY